MKEPRLEPESEEFYCCPMCGQDNINLDMGFCRDCNEYICKEDTSWVESFEDWLDHIYEDKLKAQGYL